MGVQFNKKFRKFLKENLPKDGYVDLEDSILVKDKRYQVSLKIEESIGCACDDSNLFFDFNHMLQYMRENPGKWVPVDCPLCRNIGYINDKGIQVQININAIRESGSAIPEKIKKLLFTLNGRLKIAKLATEGKI